MTHLNQFYEELRRFLVAQRLLFDFRTGKIKSSLRFVRGASFASLVPAILLALALFAPLPAEAQQFYWTGNTSTDWTTGSNWQGGAAPSTNATSTAQIRATSGTTNILTYTSAQGNSTFTGSNGGSGRGLVIGSAGNGNMSITGGTFSTLGGTAQDVVGNSAAVGTLSIDGGTYIAGSTGLNLTLGGGSNTAGTLTVNSGTATLPILQIGTVVAASTTATVNLNGGTMNLGNLTRTNTSATSTFNFNGGSLVATGNLTFDSGWVTNIRNGGAAINTGANAVSIASNLVNSGSGGLTKDGLGTLTLSGNNTYIGATTINAGTLLVDSAGRLAGGSYAGNIANNGTFTYNGTNSQTLSGIISGSGALIKNGAATLTLSGNNTYTGGTTINNAATGSGSILSMGSNNALGNGALTINASGWNTFLNLNGTNQTITSLTVLGANASVIQNQGGGNGVMTFNLADGVTSNSTSMFYFRDQSSGTGTLGLVKTGNGTLDFSTYHTMSYSGGLTVNQGVFSYNATAALGSGAITLGGGSLNYTGSTAQSITNNITLTASTTSTLNNANSTITVSGTIGGSGNLTKSGAGTLVLSGANTYTGNTTINTGVLNIQNNNALGTTAGGTTVASGAALQLQGGITVSGEALTIAGAGTDASTAPGALRNISGTNTYGGAINLSDASRIGAAAGTLNLTGGITSTNLNLTLTGAGDINVTNNAINIGTGTEWR